MQDFLQSILREDTGRGDLFSKIFHDIPKEAFSSERQIVKAHTVSYTHLTLPTILRV